MAITSAQAFKELNQAWGRIMRGTGLPNKLRLVYGREISRARLIGLFPDVVYLKWIDFYKVEFTGCIGKKVIIGDE